jgi:hypothetical protein
MSADAIYAQLTESTASRSAALDALEAAPSIELQVALAAAPALR